MNEYAQRLLAGESLRSVIGSMSPSDHQRLLEYVDKEAAFLPRFVRRKMCKRIKKYIEG